MKRVLDVRIGAAAALIATAAAVQATEIRVEVGASRAPGDISTRVEQAVKQFAAQAAKLTQAERTRRGITTQFSLPLRVVLTSNGEPLPAVRPLGPSKGPDDIVPTFDASGSRVFPDTYKTLLTDTFTQARPAMTALFGKPKVAGVVRVRNYDADIQDRRAISGGYYIPNGPDGPEIRFPVYNSNVSAAVNYIHTLLLAYMGDSAYYSDAWNEGLVRAATMGVARTPGSLPGSPASDEVEATLDSLYDISAFYDWSSQPGLGAQPFIAPNLLNTTLPPGGNTGGPYLLRYLMAGTAFAKILAEYPGFAAEFNRQFYLAPAAYTTESALVALGQSVLNTLSGSGAATIEGLSFADWVERQPILDARLNPGIKVVSQPFPISPNPGSSDFGVFGVIVHAFKTLPNGDELLLSGRSYPIFWRPDNIRFFTTSQEDTIDYSGGFGSIAPNFPSGTFNSEMYRVTVDVPYQNQLTRTYLPAGGVATGSNTSGNNFFGTLVGLPAVSGSSFYRINLSWVGGSENGIPVQNFAFGFNVADTNFLKAQPITVQVFLVNGASVTEVINRRVNKGVGSVGLDLRTAVADTSFFFNRPANLGLFGIPLQPYRPNAADLLQTGDAGTLVAVYNSVLGRYEMYPDEGRLNVGTGWFHRGPSFAGLTIRGRTSPNTPNSVALRPGWNSISSPVNQTLATTSVQVTTTTESLSTFAESLGVILGSSFFKYVPDPVLPDVGTYQEATNFVPGTGYFVRCLKQDGGVMAFMAGAPPSRPTSSKSMQSMAAIGGGGSWGGGGGVIGGTDWQSSFAVESFTGLTSKTLFGQSTAASNGFDPKLDSDLPSGFGGYQVYVQSSSPMYRDMRSRTTAQKFTINMDGLVPGKVYKVTYQPVTGTKSLTLVDSEAGVNRTVSTAFTYSFTAKSTRKSITISGGAF